MMILNKLFKLLKSIILLSFLLFNYQPTLAAGLEYVSVDVEGRGASVREAIDIALTEAIGRVNGKSIESSTLLITQEKSVQDNEDSDYYSSQEYQDTIASKTKGQVKEYSIISKNKEKKLLKQKDESAGDLFETLGQESKKVLNVIIKTDVGGTCEAIIASLNDLGNEKAKVKIVSSGVGGISESDANLAVAVESIILGFNVRADNAAKKIIEDEVIPLSYHSIIYELLDDVKARMSGLLDPIIKEEIVGTAEVLEVFNSPKFGQVAGCNVIEGNVLRNKPVRVLRDDIVIFEGELNSLRRFKEDVNEVKNGNECGMGIKNYKDIKVGDKIEVFDRKEEAQTI